MHRRPAEAMQLPCLQRCGVAPDCFDDSSRTRQAQKPIICIAYAPARTLARPSTQAPELEVEPRLHTWREAHRTWRKGPCLLCNDKRLESQTLLPDQVLWPNEAVALCGSYSLR